MVIKFIEAYKQALIAQKNKLLFIFLAKIKKEIYEVILTNISIVQ